MDYNKAKYKISLIKELNYFKSVFIFLFFTFLLNSYLPAQIQKIFRYDSRQTSLFGNTVNIFGDYALISSADNFYFEDGEASTIEIYKKQNNEWKYLKELNGYGGRYAYVFGGNGCFLNDEVVFYWAYHNYDGGLENIVCYHNIKTMKYDTIFPTKKTSIITNFGYSYPWLVVTEYSEINIHSFKINYLFYKEEDGVFNLKQSISSHNDEAYEVLVLCPMSKDYAIISNTEGMQPSNVLDTVFVCKRNNDNWTVVQNILHPDMPDKISGFGISTALSESSRFLAISALAHKDTVKSRMCVYIYELKNGKYELIQKILDFKNPRSQNFGQALSITDSTLLISNESAFDLSFKGAVHYYIYDGQKWNKKSTISPPISDTKYDGFGISIDQSGEWVIIGAEFDKTIHEAAGAAYILRIPARDTITTSICKGEGYAVGDTTYYESGTYRDTLIASYGVDSVVVLNLTVLPVSKSQIDTLLCEGESLTVGDKTLSESGSYEIKLKNTYGCDSTVNVKLRMIERDYHLPDTTLCFGKTFTIGNQNISESGIYNIPLKNINACDSIIHIKVDFIPPDIVVRDTSVCSGESLNINGEEINESGTYNFPLINKYGCDSTVTYNVKFNSSNEIKIDTSICEGNIIKVGDQSFTQSGKYLINLQNISGCDSIIELSLKMLRVSRKELDTILCPDQSIKIGNQEISGSGHYQITLQNSAGCDSIIDLTVKNTELDTSVSILNDIGCASGAIELTTESNAPPLQYLWSNGSTELSNTGLLKGKYELRITDHAGCKYVLQFDVPERKPYYIPEVFTPDDQNEEINRTFRIFTTDPEDIEPRVKVHSIKIFNRWGETVYSSESNSFWDGTFRKSPAPAGVYLYSIAIESPCGTENVKGQVLLLR